MLLCNTRHNTPAYACRTVWWSQSYGQPLSTTTPSRGKHAYHTVQTSRPSHNHAGDATCTLDAGWHADVHHTCCSGPESKALSKTRVRLSQAPANTGACQPAPKLAAETLQSSDIAHITAMRTKWLTHVTLHKIAALWPCWQTPISI
jgi:hypothetical protein